MKKALGVTEASRLKRLSGAMMALFGVPVFALFAVSTPVASQDMQSASQSATSPAQSATNQRADVQASEQAEAERHAAIEYDRANRMTVTVRVNNRNMVPFLVDTGSERTVISDKLASELGLPSAGPLTISGVAGFMSVPSAHVNGLDLTNVRVSQFVAPILKDEDMGADGLIGVDSLQEKLVVFDFDNHRMEVKKARWESRPATLEKGEIVVTANRRMGRLIITEASVEGVPVTVVIDSGAQYSIGNIALLERLQKRKRLKNAVPTILYSVTGQQLPATMAQARKVEVGNMSLRDMPIAFAESSAFTTLKLDKKPAMLLGMHTLRAFRRVEVDFTNRRVRFITPGGVLRASETRYALGCAARAQCGQALPGS
ncbi:hypothetical protein DMP17_11125 [Pseudonocardia sp. TMWB2A]|uniref:aspartyl protease family protein n=1 Tax=Pseudonocardia sp. TMWB2A TaxID=687430 RepID=UPI00307F7E09